MATRRWEDSHWPSRLIFFAVLADIAWASAFWWNILEGPQLRGAARNALAQARKTLARERPPESALRLKHIDRFEYLLRSL